GHGSGSDRSTAEKLDLGDDIGVGHGMVPGGARAPIVADRGCQPPDERLGDGAHNRGRGDLRALRGQHPRRHPLPTHPPPHPPTHGGVPPPAPTPPLSTAAPSSTEEPRKRSRSASTAGSTGSNSSDHALRRPRSAREANVATRASTFSGAPGPAACTASPT